MGLLLVSLLFVLAVTAIMITLSKHMGLGSILGLLVAGIIVGPYTPGPSITSEVESFRHFTEIGVVFLLFLIGLEMQPSKLWSLRKEVFGLGSLQVLVSGLVIGLYVALYVERLSVAIVLGLTLALSSTAFVMQLLQERGELSTPHGKSAFAILLLQDLAIVPLLALLPLLAQGGGGEGRWYEKLLVIVVSFGLLFVFGRYILPRALDKVAKQRNKDAFLMFALLSVILSAYLMEHAGLSMALGAFIMGMMLSTSRYSYQIESSIEPFKGILMSLFFIAVGMSIDFSAIARSPLLFVEHVVVVLVLKALILYGLMLLFGATRADAIKVATLLNQSGEFGFVLFGAAKALGVIDDAMFVLGIGVISISMLFTPILYNTGISFSKRFSNTSELSYFAQQEHGGKVVVAGYGNTGRVIAWMLKSANIPFVVFDNNPNVVHLGRKEGMPIFFGDITEIKFLETIKIDQASMVIVSIDKSNQAIKIVTYIKENYPHIRIIARAIDIKTMDQLLHAGASWVLAETLESSVRIGAEALLGLGVEGSEVEGLLETLRKNEYDRIREIMKN